MIVSFLIPTRGRLQALLDGIRSIKECASPDVQVEILVRIDEDDYETLAGCERILNTIGIGSGGMGEIIIGPRWCGYDCVYMFYNETAAKSHGDWLILWNDDTFMVTQKWDKLLEIDNEHVRVIWLFSSTSWSWAFPAINRKLYNLWDCFSTSTPADAVIFEVWRQAGKPIPDHRDHSKQIVINHIRNEDNIRALSLKREDQRLPPSNVDFVKKDLVGLLRNAV